MRSRPHRRAAKSITARAATRPPFPARAPPRAARRRRSSVMYPPFEENILAERGRREAGEQHHGQRRGVGRIPEGEADLIDVIEQQGGGIVGAAARQDRKSTRSETQS